jgi:hypothetical protein
MSACVWRSLRSESFISFALRACLGIFEKAQAVCMTSLSCCRKQDHNEKLKRGSKKGGKHQQYAGPQIRQDNIEKKEVAAKKQVPLGREEAGAAHSTTRDEHSGRERQMKANLTQSAQTRRYHMERWRNMQRADSDSD